MTEKLAIWLGLMALTAAGSALYLRAARAPRLRSLAVEHRIAAARRVAVRPMLFP